MWNLLKVALIFRKLHLVKFVQKCSFTCLIKETIIYLHWNLIADLPSNHVLQGAINVHGHLKLFKWTNVTTIAMKEGACSVTMEESAEFEISESSFPRLRPFSILVEEGFVSITNSKFSLIQNGAVRLASVSSFNFTGNEVDGSSGSFYVLSPDVTFSKNIFSDFSGKQLLHWETHKNR